MRFWVDIEDAAGVKQGAGPIISGRNWTATPCLNAVGSWSFEMPALDAQQELVRVGRVARAFAVAAGQVVELGGGPIERIELRATNQAPMLTISGDDRLRELVNRSVGVLGLYATAVAHPASTRWYDSGGGGSWVEIPLTTDLDVGDAGTYENFELGSTKFLYVNDPAPFRGVRVVFVTPNAASPCAVKLEYWNGSTWVEISEVTDGTAVGGVGLSQNGDITFEVPAAWTPNTGANIGLYELRLSTVGNTSFMDVGDVAVLREQATDGALATVMGLVAGEWSLDTVLGYASTTPATLTGDSLLADGGFEEYTGTPDDGTADLWDHWTPVTPGLSKAEVTATHVSGSYGVKLTVPAGGSGSIYQDATVAEGTEYWLAGWAQGDGSVRPRVRVLDLSHSADEQWLTPEVALPAAAAWAAFGVRLVTPVGCTSVRVFLYGAAGGSVIFDAVSLNALVAGGVYLQTHGESILETLIAIHEQTGDNFCLSPGGGRRVTWLRNEARPAGLRAIRGVNWVENGSDAAPELALIRDLRVAQSRYELATRVYPRGQSLAAATLALPDGWTLDTGSNCVIWTTAETALGRIERVIDVVDPAPDATDGAADQARFRANGVLAQCYMWLLNHAATDTHPLTGNVPRAYDVELVKCYRLVWPGYQVRVVYDAWVDGYHAVAIDADLWVLAATLAVNEQGLQTVRLKVASAPVAPARSGAEQLALELRALRRGRAEG